MFTEGGSLLKRYKVPEAKLFTRQFCGSSVARFVPERNAAMIPAGSLDNEAPIKPQARIFWDSRAEWSCDDDALPRYAGYPA